MIKLPASLWQRESVEETGTESYQTRKQTSEKGFLYKINGKLSNQIYEEVRQERLAWLIRTW